MYTQSLEQIQCGWISRDLEPCCSALPLTIVKSPSSPFPIADILCLPFFPVYCTNRLVSLLYFSSFCQHSPLSLTGQAFLTARRIKSCSPLKSETPVFHSVPVLMLAVTCCPYCTSVVALRGLLCIFHHCMAV